MDSVSSALLAQGPNAPPGRREASCGRPGGASSPAWTPDDDDEDTSA
jgi:hypothetical protein